MARAFRSGSVSGEVQTERRVVRGYSAGRRAYDARRRGEKLDFDAKAWRDLVQHDSCSYCRAPAVDGDHIVPLGDGGRNEWDNFTGACRSCNRSKRNKPLLLWMLGRLS